MKDVATASIIRNRRRMNRKITDVLRIYIVPIPVTDHIYRHPFPFLIFYLLRYRPDFFFLFYIETVKPIHFLPIHLLNPFSLVGEEDPSATYILFVYSLVSYPILPARIPNKFGNRWNVLLLGLMEWRQSFSFILFHNKPLSMYLLEQTKEKLCKIPIRRWSYVPKILFGDWSPKLSVHRIDPGKEK